MGGDLKVWESPDGKIRKVVVNAGEAGLKPYENSSCKINIFDCDVDVAKDYFGVRDVIVGENDSEFGRLLDKCLQTMNKNEEANVTFKLNNLDVNFTLHLIDYELKGFIYEWDAKQKYQLALHHKEIGNRLFKNRYVDASHRFGKALKILCSIPIAVESSPKIIDTVEVSDIEQLKSNLYNNLASCYLKNGSNETVIELCSKVLLNDPNNVKALYRTGIAWCNENDYEKAKEYLQKVLDLEPDNTAAKEKFAYVNMKYQEAQAKVNAIIKKMFSL